MHTNNMELNSISNDPPPRNYTQGEGRPSASCDSPQYDNNEVEGGRIHVIGESRRPFQEYLRSFPAIMKILGSILVFLTTLFGCISIYTAPLYRQWDNLMVRMCGETTLRCPSEWESLENSFVGLSIICLLLSAVNIYYSFMYNFPNNSFTRMVDAGCWGFIGSTSVAAGICLMTAVELMSYWDWNANEGNNTERESFHGRLAFTKNMTAGALAIVNGIIYFGTVVVILLEHKIPPRFQINRRLLV